MRIGAEAPPRPLDPSTRTSASPTSSHSFAAFLELGGENQPAASPSTLELSRARRVFGFDALGLFGRSQPVHPRNIEPRSDEKGSPEAGEAPVPPPILPANSQTVSSTNGAAVAAPPLPPLLPRSTLATFAAPAPLTALASAQSVAVRSASAAISVRPAPSTAGFAEPGEAAAKASAEAALTRVRVGPHGRVANAPPEDGPDALPEPGSPAVRLAPPAKSQAPVTLTFLEQQSGVKLAAFAPGLSTRLASRLRKTCAELLSRFGLKLEALMINGGEGELPFGIERQIDGAGSR